MGRTTWPCPHCGQAQTQEHPNGQHIAATLCAACREKLRDEIEALRQEDPHWRNAQTRKAAAGIYVRYGWSEEEARTTAEGFKAPS